MTNEQEIAIERLERIADSGRITPIYLDAISIGVAAIRRLENIERWPDTRLSQRLRAGIECAQWVIDEVVILEQALANAQEQL